VVIEAATKTLRQGPKYVRPKPSRSHRGTATSFIEDVIRDDPAVRSTKGIDPWSKAEKEKELALREYAHRHSKSLSLPIGAYDQDDRANVEKKSRSERGRGA